MNNKKIGVVTCTIIVAGNMMGSGITMLPSSLANIGSITIFSWFFAILGATLHSLIGTTIVSLGVLVFYANRQRPKINKEI
jgi:amino acid transporter